MLLVETLLALVNENSLVLLSSPPFMQKISSKKIVILLKASFVS